MFLDGNAASTPYLDKLSSFNLVGYGCTTRISNSGPLPAWRSPRRSTTTSSPSPFSSGAQPQFRGADQFRLVRANYLASPPLVVAYAIAGTDGLTSTWYNEPIMRSPGAGVFLKDIWPTSQAEVADGRRQVGPAPRCSTRSTATPSRRRAAERFKTPGPRGDLYEWDATARLTSRIPLTCRTSGCPPSRSVVEIKDARALAVLGDSITTDHISPAGSTQGPGAGGAIPDRARRADQRSLIPTARLEQSRGHGPRYLRQHPPRTS